MNDTKFFNVDDYYKDKEARTEKKHAKDFEITNKKFGKLHVTLKKQAIELGFYDIEDFDIQVEEGVLEKLKMSNMPMFDGTGDQKAHLRSYLIAIRPSS